MMKTEKLKFTLYDRKKFRHYEFTSAEDVVDALWKVDLEDVVLMITNSHGYCGLNMGMLCSEAGRLEAFLKMFKDD